MNIDRFTDSFENLHANRMISFMTKSNLYFLLLLLFHWDSSRFFLSNLIIWQKDMRSFIRHSPVDIFLLSFSDGLNSPTSYLSFQCKVKWHQLSVFTKSIAFTFSVLHFNHLCISLIPFSSFLFHRCLQANTRVFETLRKKKKEKKRRRFDTWIYSSVFF